MSTSAHSLKCPHCGSELYLSHGKRYALYPAGCVVIMSLPISWLHRSSTPHEFECLDCGKRFAKRTRPAKIAFGLVWVLISVLALSLILIILDSLI